MIGKMLARQCFHLVRTAGIASPAESQAISSILKTSLNKSLVSNFRASHYSSLVQVQKPAPAFKGTAVVKGDFKDIDVCDFKGQYLVLFFYPLDFTFVCPTEIIAFSDRIDEFKAINTAVVGVSCDSHFSHLAWINTPRKHGGLGELKYPLLSDFNKTIARDYNVLLENDGVPLRGLFIIDPESIVRQITVNDLPVGRSVDEVLRLVKAFQFTDKHGEVECVDPKEDKVGKNLQKKFSVQNIKPKPSYGNTYRYLASEETSETKDLSVQQLERLVLLDQLKFYRKQMEDLQGKQEEVKKEEKSTVNLLQERDCIAV